LLGSGSVVEVEEVGRGEVGVRGRDELDIGVGEALTVDVDGELVIGGESIEVGVIESF
jgi:hypothetical protein